MYYFGIHSVNEGTYEFNGMGMGILVKNCIVRMEMAKFALKWLQYCPKAPGKDSPKLCTQ